MSLVLNTLTHLAVQAAKRVLKRSRPIIIAINGSVGKTSVRQQMVAALNASGYSVQSSQKNFNTLLGVALTVLGVQNYLSTVSGLVVFSWKVMTSYWQNFNYDFLVVELGIDQIGDAAELLTLIQPDIAVITSIAPAHLQGFEAQGVSQALDLMIKETIAHAAQAKTIIFNADEIALASVLKSFPGQKISYGYQAGADIQVEKIESVFSDAAQLLGQTIWLKNSQINSNNQSNWNLSVFQAGVIGRPVALAAAAGASLLQILNLDLPLISLALSAEIIWPLSRMRVWPNKFQGYFIDDTYNASPEAVEAWLESFLNVLDSEKKLFQSSYQSQRYILILGSMNELGSESQKYHQKIGQKIKSILAAEPNVWCFTVGTLAQDYFENDYSEFSSGRVQWFAQVEDLIHQADKLWQKHDRIWLKGSQNGVRLEKLAVTLLPTKYKAQNCICRQGYSWK